MRTWGQSALFHLPLQTSVAQLFSITRFNTFSSNRINLAPLLCCCAYSQHGQALNNDRTIWDIVGDDGTCTNYSTTASTPSNTIAPKPNQAPSSIMMPPLSAMVASNQFTWCNAVSVGVKAQEGAIVHYSQSGWCLVSENWQRG